MTPGIYGAANTMQALQVWQEAAASNLANAGTSGYKRVVGTLHAAPGQPAGYVQRHDHSAGALERTGHALDLALGGDAFFVVEAPRKPARGPQQPEGYYTRSGSVRVVDGVLHLGTAPLLGVDGPLRLNDPQAPFLVDSGGVVTQGGERVGRLKLVTFADPKPLAPLGGGLFKATEPDSAQPAGADVTVHQGFREQSNVDVVEELVGLIAIQRAFEATNQAVRSQGQALGKLIDHAG